jgi:hypothetical protein
VLLKNRLSASGVVCQRPDGSVISTLTRRPSGQAGGGGTFCHARTPPLVRLKAVCGPGDEGEPVIIVMLPDED